MNAPHDRPSSAELVEAVREWIRRSHVERELEPNTFHARVAVNMLAIVERELALGPAQEQAHRERLDRLGVTDDTALASAIRSGVMDDQAEEVRRVVWDTVRDKLAVANPTYLDRVEP